jgi:UDP-3-O-[3-hydroxymyristoyl] N-acetylglucosamine deacetylase
MLHQDFAHLRFQHTVFSPIAFVGIGLHSGRRVTLRILPAPANHGIRVTRRDLPDGENIFFARWDRVSGTELCTTLDNDIGHHVATVEHLLSALGGLGIDNAEIVLDGPEVPIVDGSAMPFVSALQNAGIRRLEAGRDLLVVRRPVRIQQGEQWAELLPDTVPRITLSIDFRHEDIGRQCISLCVSPVSFVREIAPARTFGFAEELWQLRRRGLARGGSIKNAILLEQGRVANLEGLRFSDEFARHKALDVVGDLTLAGLPIIGHYRANRPGHRLNNDLLRLLMNDAQSWQRVAASDLLDSGDGVSEPRRAAAKPMQAGQANEPARQSSWRDVVERVLGQRNKDSGA